MGQCTGTVGGGRLSSTPFGRGLGPLVGGAEPVAGTKLGVNSRSPRPIAAPHSLCPTTDTHRQMLLLLLFLLLVVQLVVQVVVVVVLRRPGSVLMMSWLGMGYVSPSSLGNVLPKYKGLEDLERFGWCRYTGACCKGTLCTTWDL